MGTSPYQAALLRPRLGFHKPRGLPRLVRTPLLENVLDTYVFPNIGPPVNLTGRTGTVTLVSSPGYRTTAIGQGGYGTGGKYFRLPLTTCNAGGSKGWTFRIVCMPISWPGSFTAWLDSSARTICQMSGTSGVRSFGGIYGSDPSTTLSMPVNVLADVVLTGTSGSPFNAVWYLNGAQIRATSYGGGTTEDIYLGNNISGGGSNPDMVYFLVQTWQRALSAGEVAAAYHNPWQFAEWPEDRQDFVGATSTPATSKYLVKPLFTLPGGLIVPIGAGAYAARALQHNVPMTRRRAFNFFGWNRDNNEK